MVRALDATKVKYLVSAGEAHLDCNVGTSLERVLGALAVSCCKCLLAISSLTSKGKVGFTTRIAEYYEVGVVTVV